MAGKQIVSRRRFFQRTSMVAAAAVALPTLVRSSALGLCGSVAPSERITLGLCGPSPDLAQGVREFLRYPDARVVVHSDWNELVASPEIDAFLMAASGSGSIPRELAAACAAKDVFCEAAENLTIAEGRALADAMSAGNRLFQAAFAARWLPAYRRLVEAVRSGQIGDLKTIAIAAPDTVWAARLIDVAQWANATESIGPVDIESRVASGFRVRYRYAKGVVMEIRSGCPAIRLEGTSGWIASDCWGGPLQTGRQSVLDFPGVAPLRHSAGLAASLGSPYRNFLDRIKSRQISAVSAEVAHRTATLVNLGGMAARLGRILQWNPYAENFIDDAEADALRGSRASVWMA